MKLIINKNQISENPAQFLRRAGYAFIRDRRTGSESFVRRLTRDFYPRLHMYVEQDNDNIFFNLHLDQKQTSYAGAHMHNAEYGGPVVKEEIERLNKLIIPSSNRKSEFDMDQKNIFDKVGDGSFEKTEKEKDEKRGFWRKLFG